MRVVTGGRADLDCAHLEPSRECGRLKVPGIDDSTPRHQVAARPTWSGTFQDYGQTSRPGQALRRVEVPSFVESFVHLLTPDAIVNQATLAGPQPSLPASMRPIFAVKREE